MCGIAGIISKEQLPLAGPLVGMTEVVGYRGPDAYGYVCLNSDTGDCQAGQNIDDDLPFHIGLGHRRLAIIDLSERASQPMMGRNGCYWLVFNGAIYNYLELRNDLLRNGHRFKSESDTEVVLRSYIEFGKRCFSMFNGMWAMAIIDLNKKEVILARDRFGIKPLYVYHDDALVLFTSEVKQMLQYPGFTRQVNPDSVEAFLEFGLAENTAGDTFFKGIRAVPPSTLVTISLDRQLPVHREKYYEIQIDASIEGQDEKETAEYFLQLLQDSVQIRLRSDVTIGTSISGGIDSSSIASLAISQLRNRQQSFKAINFFSPGKRYDERPYVNELANRYDLDTHYVTFTPQEGLELLPNIIWHQDMPLSSPSVIAQWRVFEQAKLQGTKVMLDGQGADEMLGGYPPFFLSFFLELLHKNDFLCLSSELMYFFLHIFRINVFLKAVWREIRKKLAGNCVLPQIAHPDITGRFNKDCFNHITGGNLETLLRYEDRNSMAHAIETRLPFLDYRIVDFALSVPASLKIRNGYSKYLLREIMKHHIPDLIRMRREKIGFFAPVKQLMQNILKEDNALAKEIKSYNNGRTFGQDMQWRVLCFFLWKRVFNV